MRETWAQPAPGPFRVRENPQSYDQQAMFQLYRAGLGDPQGAAAVFYDYVAERLALPQWMTPDALYDALLTREGGYRDEAPRAAKTLTLGAIKKHLAHAVSNVYDLEELTEAAGLHTPNQWQDRMDSFERGTYSYTYQEALREGESEERATELAETAEEKERDEEFYRYHGAVMYVLDTAAEGNHLELIPTSPEEAYPFEFFVRPRGDFGWEHVAIVVMNTIEGEGYFGYQGDLNAFLDSGPYTARQAVLVHLHVVFATWWNVWQSTSASQVFDRQLR
jgi:hypothetical protein